MAGGRTFKEALTAYFITAIAGVQVDLHLNKPIVNLGERLVFNCSAPCTHNFYLKEIGEMQQVEVLYSNDQDKNITFDKTPTCNTECKCSKIIEITATEDMNRKAYQCYSYEPGGNDHIRYHSEGQYVTVVGIDPSKTTTISGIVLCSPTATPTLPTNPFTGSLSDTEPSKAGSFPGHHKQQQAILILLCILFIKFIF